MSVRKMTGALSSRRGLSPFMQYLRGKMLRIRRAGRSEYSLMQPNRWTDSQSSRDPDPPNLPGGIHHEIDNNYYLGRDARRTVEPEPAMYLYAGEEKKYSGQEEPERPEPINKSPEINFGFRAPTPGVGVEWKRNPLEEDLHVRLDKDFKQLEKYDRFTKSN